MASVTNLRIAAAGLENLRLRLPNFGGIGLSAPGGRENYSAIDEILRIIGTQRKFPHPIHPRKYVEVDCGIRLIEHADVNPLRLNDIFDSFDSALEQRPEFFAGRFWQVAQAGDRMS